jgi:hypothetical protein
MAEQRQNLTTEELEEQDARELPEREEMSVIQGPMMPVQPVGPELPISEVPQS